MSAPRTRRTLLRAAGTGLAASLTSLTLAGCVSDGPGTPTSSSPGSASPPATDRSPTPDTDTPPGSESTGGSPSPTTEDTSLPIGRGYETPDGEVVAANPVAHESLYYLPYPDSVGVVAEADTQFLTVQMSAEGTVPPPSRLTLEVDDATYGARTQAGDGVPVFELGMLTDGLEDVYEGRSQPAGYLLFGVPKALDASTVAVRWDREDGGAVTWRLRGDQVTRLNATPRWELKEWTYEEGSDGPVLLARVAHLDGRVEPFRAVVGPAEASHWFSMEVEFDAAGTVGQARTPARHLIGWSGNDVSGPTATFVLDRSTESWSQDVPWPEETGTETETATGD